MGDKVSAREAMSDGRRADPARHRASSRPTTQAEEAVERIGFPVIIKASAGGGGRGMKIVEDRERLSAQLAAGARRGAGRLRQPRGLPRALRRGAAPHRDAGRSPTARRGVRLGERECSIQRRHQKLIEEAPSVALDDERARRSCWRIARKATQAIGYTTVGTLEFLLDEDKQLLLHGDEHAHPGRAPGDRDGDRRRSGARADPARRRRAAAHRRNDIRPRGHAIECASTPRTRSPSRRRRAGSPRSTCRAASACGSTPTSTTSYVVPPHYDSLLAKLIVRAENRPAALARLRRALAEFVVEGCKTNLDFHRRLLANADFIAGQMDTHLVERMSDRPGSASDCSGVRTANLLVFWPLYSHGVSGKTGRRSWSPKRTRPSPPPRSFWSEGSSTRRSRSSPGSSRRIPRTRAPGSRWRRLHAKRGAADQATRDLPARPASSTPSKASSRKRSRSTRTSSSCRPGYVAGAHQAGARSSSSWGWCPTLSTSTSWRRSTYQKTGRADGGAGARCARSSS